LLALEHAYPRNCDNKENYEKNACCPGLTKRWAYAPDECGEKHYERKYNGE